MENAGNGCGAAPKLCPSAQPGMDNCRVLGVVQHDTPQPMLLYLKEPVAATPDVLAMAAPLKTDGSLPVVRHVRDPQVSAL